MTTHSFQCPACGAPLMPRGGAAVMSCPHCLTSVVVPEGLRQEMEEAKWTTLLFDPFTSNDHNWLLGSTSSEYFDPLSRTIADGRYRWEANIGRANSISKVWLGEYKLADLHLAANCKHILGSRANSAWGLIFRVLDNQNYYWFRITDTKFYAVSYTKDGQWSDLKAWTRTEAIKSSGVNQLEVIAQGSHFVFLINGQIVSEEDDAHFAQGYIGLAVEAYEPGERIAFDFLDVTLRGQS